MDGIVTCSGIDSLVIVARYHGIAADPDAIRHHLGTTPESIGSNELVRAARWLQLKSRAIRIEGLTFRYRPGTTEVLRDLSLDVAPGEVLGIVGPSGSGKSTLTKLVQRRYVPEAGRALVTDPRILIFDEATSALDYESEYIIQRNMRAICRDRTVLIIAHRLASVRFADRIVVLDRGAIVEHGSHAELLDRNGYYARLYRLQTEMLGEAQP